VACDQFQTCATYRFLIPQQIRSLIFGVLDARPASAFVQNSGISSCRVCLLALAFLSWQFKTVQIAATFNSDRLRLIDSSFCGASISVHALQKETELARCIADPEVNQSAVLLIRGNAPLNGNGQFDSEMLVSAIEKRVRELLKNSAFSLRHPGMTMQQEPRIVIIGLLSSRVGDEAAVLEIEKKGADSDGGGSGGSVKLIHAPIHGVWYSMLPFAFDGILLFLRVDPTGGTWALSS